MPSRIESFCFVAAEAHSCGTPVVAFKTSGLIDVVKHKITGYLAEPFDCLDFSIGIKWVLEKSCKDQKVNFSARERALKLWNQNRIGNLYKSLYEELISKKS